MLLLSRRMTRLRVSLSMDSQRRTISLSRGALESLRYKRARGAYVDKDTRSRSPLPFNRIKRLAFDSRANDAFSEYRQWLDNNKDHVLLLSSSSSDMMQRNINAATLGVLLVSLYNVAQAMTAKQFFQETKNDNDDNQVSLLDRLREIEELIRQYDVVLQWQAMLALLKMETALYRLKRGFDGTHTPGAVERAATNDRGLAELDAMIERVDELKKMLMWQHSKEPSDLSRDGDRLCVFLMHLEQAKGNGLSGVLRCYQERLAQSQVDVVSSSMNDALVRLAKAEIRETIGVWSARDEPAALRAKMPTSLVDDVRQVLAIVSTMRFIYWRTFKVALHVALVLNDAEATALVLDAIERVTGTIDNQVITVVLNTCLRFEPRNSVAVVDQVWRLYHSSLSSSSSSRRLKPSPAVVGLSIKLYRRAGAIDKLIDVYEHSIDVFNVDVDARNVAALMHSVVDRRYGKASTEQQMRALKLAKQSGLIDHTYVRRHVNRLPKSTE
jgi:hypothetical protein